MLRMREIQVWMLRDSVDRDWLPVGSGPGFRVWGGLGSRVVILGSKMNGDEPMREHFETLAGCLIRTGAERYLEAYPGSEWGGIRVLGSQIEASYEKDGAEPVSSPFPRRNGFRPARMP